MSKQAAPQQKGKSFWSCLCPCLAPAPSASSYEQDEKTASGGGGDVSHLVTQVSQDDKTRNQPAPVPMTRPQQTSSPLPSQQYLLPAWPENKERQKCLVLDLDETLVHSSFVPIPNADFVITLDLQGTMHRVYVRKRPHVDEFLKWCGPRFEVVIFTASLSKYADPLLDKLDIHKAVQYRLFREHCVQHDGNYVKDLSHLGRPLKDCIIVDNSPFSYQFQVQNSIPVISWFNDQHDQQLFELIGFLETLMVVDDVVTILSRKRLNWCSMPFDENG